MRGHMRWLGVLIWCVGAPAAIVAGSEAPAALAASKTVPATATLLGERAFPSRSQSAPVSRSIPLRVIEPVAYARQKREAGKRARAKAQGSSDTYGALVGSRSSFGPNAVLFESLNSPGLSGTGALTPPDTTGAIGPAHYVEFVNSEVAAFSRTSLGEVGSPVDLSTFIGGIAVCDPQIKYDPQSSRWFYAALRCDGTQKANRLYLGFSKTSDPTDFSIAKGHGWCGYEYPTGEALEDYPKLGVDSTHIILGTNSFNAVSEEFVSAHIFAGAKPTGTIVECPAAPALKEFGAPAPLKTSLGKPAFTPEPATVSGESPTGFVVSADIGQKNLMIWQIGGTASKPELIPLGAPEVPFFNVPPNVPQPGSTDELDTMDARLTQAVAAPDPNAGGAEAVWTEHTIEGGGRSVVRWYEIVPSKVEVRQDGTLSEPGKFVFNGAIAPTLSGGAVVNYNTGSSSSFVQVMAQSRIGSTPLGTMNTPILLASSSAADADFSCPTVTKHPEPCRWGDYAGASVDPINENVVWGSNQTDGPFAEGSAQWRTRNFALEPNDLVPVASFSVAPNPVTAGSPAGFNAGGSTDPDGPIASYSWNFGDGSAAGSGIGPTHVFVAPGTYTVTLTVTDNKGKTSSASKAVSVVAAPASSTPTPPSPPSEPASSPKPPPDSSFAAHATFDANTGTITVRLTVANSGMLRWLATFANGRFGVFAARATKCKPGQVRLRRRCRPTRVMYGKGSKAAASGSVTFTIKPTLAGRRALKAAARRKKGVPITLAITFRSLLGGVAVTHASVMTVRLRH
jgi:hypothetical protein